MSISSEKRKTGIYVGNGTVSEYPFDFKVFSATELAVIVADKLGNETKLVYGKDYSVSLNSNQDLIPGGAVKVTEPLADGYKMVIASDIPYLQPTVFTNHGGFYPTVLNTALDRLTALIQQLFIDVARSVKVSLTTSEDTVVSLPSASPGKGIGWNEAGTALVNTDYHEQAKASAEAAKKSKDEAATVAAEAAKQAVKGFFEYADKKLAGTTPPVIQSINDLRSHTTIVDGDSCIVIGYHANTPGLGVSLFYADLNDKSTVDNGCTIIVSGDVRWKREDSSLNLHHFGYAPDLNNAKATLLLAENARLGAYVDCLGLTIPVDGDNTAYPFGNKYYNGKVLINGVVSDLAYTTPRTGNGRVLIGDGVGSNLTIHETPTAGVVAIGNGAMGAMARTVNSIAIGKNAMSKGDTSRDNIAIGEDALLNVSSDTWRYDQNRMAGTRNVAIGGNALLGVKKGQGNIAIGRNSGQGIENGKDNVAIGRGAMAGTAPVGLDGEINNFYPQNGSGHVVIGANAMQDYVGSEGQTVIGYYAGQKIKTATETTVIGNGALKLLDSDMAPNGGDIVWTGTETGTYAQDGTTLKLVFANVHNTVVGSTIGIRLLDGEAKTLQNDIVPAVVEAISGNEITVISSASYTTSGAAELRYVYSAKSSTEQSTRITAIGYSALSKSKTASKTVAIGAMALQGGSTQSSVVAIGSQAGSDGEHHNSVIIGQWAAPRCSSSNSVFIGDSAGWKLQNGTVYTGHIHNSIAIGAYAAVSGSNEIQIGSGNQTVYMSGQVNVRSDMRDKADIQPLGLGVDFLRKINPIKGVWDRRDDYVTELFLDEPEQTRKELIEQWWKNPVKDGSKKQNEQQFWLSAQEIASLEGQYGKLPMLKHQSENGCDTYSLSYSAFVPILINAIKELAGQVDDLKKARNK